ncbi:MAG: radical SAM protein [candidate division KSB1 bacterium]|nr:radical SAM protein [candidate division KSB1 bacterium]MDZ7342556.1 radical SAM protein [candidate division KSB1 bacterium]
MNYCYLFGPVPSRRLGRSLGVDLVPHKTCSLNCIYCECGRTTDLTLQRAEYVPLKQVISELTDFLASEPVLDYITFSGAGEPTLHSGLGMVVDFLKTNFPAYPIALLTNGTLFYQAELRTEVAPIDLILPSLDAADDETFRKLNRPHPELSVSQIILGLKELKQIQRGNMWLEIFIVPGINDHDEHLDHLKQAVHEIKPDLVQLNSLDRPGTEKWVKQATYEHLQAIAQRLDWPTEIIAKIPKSAAGGLRQDDPTMSILALIRRRPCTIEDLSQMSGIKPLEIQKYLAVLMETGQIHARKMPRGLFYWAKASR